MEILIGLAIATVTAIGWFYGNLFVCVFLSLGAALGVGFAAIIFGGGAVLAFPLLLCIVWVPRLYRRNGYTPAKALGHWRTSA